jgi:phosphotriesterase-related protein
MSAATPSPATDEPMVETMTGPIRTADLGFVLMHEHIVVRSEGLAKNFPHIWDPQPVLDRVLELLTALKARGVDTLVDLTVYGLGRDIPFLLPVVQKSGVQVIVATGIYTFNDLPTYFRNRNTDEIAELFIRDIKEGIQGTPVKPAIFKCATDAPGLMPGVEKVLRAVSRAHIQTGLPISTHSHAASYRGLEQQEIFKSEGVDLGRVIIGHSGDSDDLNYLTKLLERGSYLGMDRFALDSYLPEEKRIDTVARLCRMGWAEKMVLSHDTMAYFDVYEMEAMAIDRPKWHYFHIINDIIPKLLQAGVTEEQIHCLTRENPRRIFENTGVRE